MFKNDKFALYFIIIVAAFQCWYAGTIPAGADEIYTFFKGTNKGWFMLPHPGVGSLGAYLVSSFSDDIFILRLPYIIMTSIAAAFIFRSAHILSGRIGGWVALLFFIMSPAVNLAYVSATPAACFIMFCSIAFFFWIKAFDTNKINYYVGAGVTSGFLVLIHLSGFFLFAFALIYILIFNRKFLGTKSFLIACIFFIICPLALFIARMTGVYIVPGSVPFLFTESKDVFLALGFAGVPVIIYSIVMLIWDRFRTKEFNFLAVSFICSIIFFIILNIFTNIDLRYAPGFFIPAMILAGCYFTRKNNQVFIAVILAISVIITAYVKISYKKDLYLPSGLKTSSIYEAISFPLAKLLGNNGAVFGTSIPKASLYSYYTKLSDNNLGDGNINVNMISENNYKIKPSKHPEPCLPGICSQQDGVFVSETKDPNDLKMFSKSKYYGIFRLTKPKEGTKSFFIYTVNR